MIRFASGQRHLLRLRIPALGEVPDALLAAPRRRRPPRRARSARRASGPSCARPTSGAASRPPAVILDLAREQRPASLELAQDVAAEGGVLLQVLAAGSGRASGRAVSSAPGAAAGPRPARGTRSTRTAVRSSQSEAVELGAVVAVAEPAPEDEVLRRRDRRRSGRAAGSRGGERCRSTPVAEPSRSCARTAIRRASSTLTSRMLDPLQPEDAREARRALSRASPRRCHARSARG